MGGAVVQGHDQFVGVFHDVVIRHDVTVGRDNDARTAGTAFLLLGLALLFLLRSEEEFERIETSTAEGVGEPPDGIFLPVFDIDHGFDAVFGGCGEVGQYVLCRACGS